MKFDVIFVTHSVRSTTHFFDKVAEPNSDRNGEVFA